MNLFIDQHQELLKNLLENKVDFIVIGGYSVIYHGYARTTGDVDLWIKPDNDNKKKLVSALSNMDLFEADIQELLGIDFNEHVVFSMWDDPEKVDFITRINLLKYEDADKRKIIAEVDGIKVPFLHLDDLVRSKFNTGRLKDKADIEELQKIQKARKK